MQRLLLICRQQHRCGRWRWLQVCGQLFGVSPFVFDFVKLSLCSDTLKRAKRQRNGVRQLAWRIDGRVQTK